MTQQEYSQTQALLADVSYQSMQATNEVLASVHQVIERIKSAYNSLTPGERNVLSGSYRFGMGVVALLPPGEVIAGGVATTALITEIIQAAGPLLEVVGTMYATYDVTWGLGLTALGAAQWASQQPGQPSDDIPDFAKRLDPITLFTAATYAAGVGGGQSGLEKGCDYGNWISFLVQTMSFAGTYFDPRARFISKLASFTGTAMGATDLKLPGTSNAGNTIQSQNDLKPSAGPEMDTFGAPAHFIWGNPQQADPTKYDQPQQPNPDGSNLPDYMGGTDTSGHTVEVTTVYPGSGDVPTGEVTTHEFVPDVPDKDDSD
jgi:hypothetical protein